MACSTTNDDELFIKTKITFFANVAIGFTFTNDDELFFLSSDRYVPLCRVWFSSSFIL